MTPADVAAYHRRLAVGCRESAAIAWAGYDAGCDDAFFAFEGYRRQADEHDQMAEVVEHLLSPDAQ